MASARSSKPIPLPAAVRRGGRRGWITAAAGGAVAGAATLLVPSLLSSRDAFGFLHRRGIDTAMPWWWVPGRLGYDVSHETVLSCDAAGLRPVRSVP